MSESLYSLNLLLHIGDGLVSNVVYCEMCGRPVDRRRAKIVYIEGARLTLCPECYARVAKKAVVFEVKESASPPLPRGPPKRGYGRRALPLDEYEVVPDFAARIRRARERLGWTQRTLAEAIRESENIVKRLESGRLTPSIELARKLEGVLGVKLVEPVIEHHPTEALSTRKLKDLTLGDIVAMRKKSGSRK